MSADGWPWLTNGRSWRAVRADALGNQVERIPLLHGLLHKHQMQWLNLCRVTLQWKLCVIK